MQPHELLARARAQFEQRLVNVTPADRDKVTPCPDWTVEVLVQHVILGDLMATAILRGASREEGFATMRDAVLSDDLPAEFRRAADALASEMAGAGALERVVHHPSGDVLGAQLLGFRAGDYTYHAWDLARATGQDETLDPDVVAEIWEQISGRHERMIASGMFGQGPSGTVGDIAPLQDRLLDLVGRRP